MTDIEISRKSKKLNICDVAEKIGIKKEDLMLYGDYKAKITKIKKRKKQGKLILVTAISPTPMGEGKTTVSIGLGDALNRMGKNIIIALRQPSMGPVFGMKGGATGGGYSQVVPMEDINLHFTGDFHAITSANNLISAAIDNHIFFGNKLDIQNVLFKRCLDVNDRALRDVDLGTRRDSLKDAFLPNLVQTLENTPTIIHGGPFANIAHGCNSMMATKTALSYADYVVTEAGFGADLGAEKFLDIKCRLGDLDPHAVVLVATIKALKYHGGVSKEDIFKKNDDALIKGFENLKKHYDNLKKYGVNVVVCLNKFTTDTEDEIELLKKYCEDNDFIFTVSSAWGDGGAGAMDLADKVIKIKKGNFKPIYSLDDTIENKIKKICCNIYGASKVNISDISKKKIEIIKKNKLANLPICVAKTQYSFSDDKDKVGVPKDFEVTARDINIYNGAGFITVLLGDMMTMPGLSRKPNYEVIDVIDGKIVNLS